MPKRPEQELKRDIEQRLREIEQLEQEARQQGQAFSGLKEEELRRKLERESSPYIYSQSWTSGTVGGSTAYYTVYIANPDPTAYGTLFVSLFFGAANFLDDVGEGLSARDSRWPYLSTPAFSLAVGATTNKAFSYATPTGLAPSTYLGNAVLWQGDYHDKGSYLDRGLFPVTLS